ncbi:peroxisomal succinyl-coenzyme A thioesterase isoform X4 [Cricetulus griseus]|uniref:peroxisomal succinyl-coenzyme A thioesterase isoform X4 n=1 Tax=Cricetulus griseus TaxID=10029 RepID=UPI0015C2CE27|nr:peroxisomal succinyl-coenzyme A thioesterase isoform X4 [Cricetulus griseus]
MAVTLSLEPAGRSCWDEPLGISVHGLAPEQPVTLRAALRDEKGALFRAHARYRADDHGGLDLARAPALGGSFAGIEPMGLLWALEPERPFWRLIKRDVQTPFVVGESVVEERQPAACVSTRGWTSRKFYSSLPRRSPQESWLEKNNRQGRRLAHCLFLFPREGPFPGIIDVYGVGGGLLEYRASLVAGHGFATLALAFYGFEDLPTDFNIIEMDYFEEAVSYMRQHPQVKGPDIGLLGLSLGADLCLSMASFLKNVSATVSINGSAFSGNRHIHYKQTMIPPLGHDLRRTKVAFSGILDIVDIRNDIVGGCENPSMIPIEKAKGPILFIAGQDDHCWRSELYTQIASERLQAHGKQRPQVILYPGTGHYIEPPYFPMCPASLHKIVNKAVIWGGEVRAHSKAQVDAWKQILSFFGKHLDNTQSRASSRL